jgi:hypothetical protein
MPKFINCTEDKGTEETVSYINVDQVAPAAYHASERFLEMVFAAQSD